MDILVDGRGEKQLRVVSAVNFERLMQVTPLVGGSIGGVNAHAAKRPDPANDRQQSVAMFIQHLSLIHI